MKSLPVILVLVLAFFAVSTDASARPKKKKPAPEKSKEVPEAKPDESAKEEKTEGEAEKEEEDPMTKLVKDCDLKKGLFDIYQNRKTGEVYVMVKRKQLGKEYIYFTKTSNGVVQAGHFRGSFRDTKVFSIRKHFNRLEFVAENTSFFFDPDNAISRAADANISPAVLASEEIAAEDGKRYLIKADKVFLKEVFHRVKYPSKGDGFALGNLSSDKTKFSKIRNYPENTVFVVDYVYDNPGVKGSAEAEVTDPRYVTITLQHTLIRMPKNDYKPRFDDARVGYFMSEVNDMTSVDSAPYRDVIHRWHLKKKDPGAKLSEPVEPIVFWIENTTPHDLRPTIREAALRWNEAFETAGFKNAIEVRQQPDDAEWDADDIRYNVLRWTSSPNPPFGGYGPSFVNPRTGQILGADIMLEYAFLTNRLRYGGVFTSEGIAGMEGEGFGDDAGERSIRAGMARCLVGASLQSAVMVGAQTLRLANVSTEETEKMVRQSISQLILHEIGHTLGLNHNFMASHLHGPKAIHNPKVTRKSAVTSSVMDYAVINLAPPGTKQGDYFTFKPGPYDHWAIQFGYSEALAHDDAEEERLEKILARSTQPGLGFGNDADDMRSAGKGIDPRIMVNDLSSDPIAYGEGRCELATQVLGNLLKEFPKEGESYHGLRIAYLTLTGEMSRALTAISRYVGGVRIDRAVEGQKGGGDPFTPVPEAEQRRAMAALGKWAFAPGAFQVSEELFRHLQMQRRGFNFRSEGEDPKLHERTLNIQGALLSQLMHKNVVERILDSGAYGNTYTLSEVMSDLTKSITEGDGDAIDTFRQQLQLSYLDRLILMLGDSGYPRAAKSVALFEIEKIRERFSAMEEGVNAAHAALIAYKIRRALDE